MKHRGMEGTTPEILRLARNGLTATQIAEKVGMSPDRIRDRCRRHRVKLTKAPKKGGSKPRTAHPQKINETQAEWLAKRW